MFSVVPLGCTAREEGGGGEEGEGGRREERGGKRERGDTLKFLSSVQ